ncbi:MAG: hypothetical protein JNM50_04070 [Chromatiales bacterium]|nr:hypothetical protein [Chromatiales bacterium]
MTDLQTARPSLSELFESGVFHDTDTMARLLRLIRRRLREPVGAEELRAYRRRPNLGSGTWVAIGPEAPAFAEARRRCFPVLTPHWHGRDPVELDWRIVAGEAVLLIERGCFDTDLLERTAYALLRDGARLVYPIRPALFAERRSWPPFVAGGRHG